MTKREATKWLRRFYYALKKEEVRVRLKKNMRDPRVRGKDRYVSTKVVFGIKGHISAFNDGEGNIHLNPSRQRFGGITMSLIHELLHEVDSAMTEVNVRKTEKKIYEALSDKQLQNLLVKALTT